MLQYLSQEWLDEFVSLTRDLPSRPGASVRIQYKVTGGPGGDIDYYWVVSDGQGLDAKRGALDGADVTMTNTYDDAARIQRGELDPTAAFMQGKIKVAGDSSKVTSLLPITTSPEWMALQEKIASITEYPELSRRGGSDVRRLIEAYNYGTGRSADLQEVWNEIARLDLMAHVAELETRGYTIIPPEKVAPPEVTDSLRTALLQVAERRSGEPPDLEGASVQGPTPFGLYMSYLLFEDRAFEEAVMNPTVLAMASYLCGKSAQIYTVTGFAKGPGGVELPLHSDNIMVPAPYPPYAQICNATWLLTDYSAELGGTCFVPGSQRYCRAPELNEGLDERVPVDAPAGSLVVWHGNTWHGAVIRQTPGLRLGVALMYCRGYITPQEPYSQDVTKEILDRNPPRFAKLMGQHIPWGFREEGVDFVKVSTMPGKSVWD